MKTAAWVLAALGVTALLAADKRLVEGRADSPVRVIIYEDLQCSDCANFRRMLDEKLLPAYAARVAFEHRDFPLPKHAWARWAAIASRFFEEQDPKLAVEWRRRVLADFRDVTAESFPAYLGAFAARNGADEAKAVASLNDERLKSLVQKDYEEGVARGVARTPTVLVNGEPFIETFTFEQIAQGIEYALREAGAK